MSDPRKFKGKVRLETETASTVATIDSNKDITSSSVTTTELGYVSGVTSPIQGQINTAQSTADAAQTDATQALADAATAQADIDAHIADTVGAHAATAISNTPSGNLAATEVQAALNELQGDIDSVSADVADLVTLSGVAANSTDLGTFTGTTIPDSSTIKAALQALETELDAIPSPFYYAGVWAASTNTPALADGTGTLGAVYYVTDSGTVDFGAGPQVFNAGDKVAYNGTTWDKWDMTDAVASVFGRTGAVVSTNGDYTASQVTNVPSGNLAAIEVQAALNELQTDIDTRALDSVVIKKDGSVAFTANQSMGGFQLTNLADPTLAQDAATKAYVDAATGSFTGGDGIAIAASVISVDHDGEGLTFVATQLALELDGATLSKSATGLKLSDTTVTPGTYGSASETVTYTVDQQGRLTASSEQSINITASQVSDFNATSSAAAPVQSVNTQTGAVVLTTTNITEGTSLYFTDERAQDAVGTILVDSNTIDFTYNDATPSIVADVKTQMSITSDASGIKLVNDELTPGNTEYYGTNSVGTKGFYPIPAVGSAGDIQETSFSLANNQVTPADVTGFLFPVGTVRSFSSLTSVEIDATADLYEQFTLQGINKASSFNMSVDSTGDASGIVFSITSSGQVQYTSANYAGFVAGLIKFRAITTSV